MYFRRSPKVDGGTVARMAVSGPCDALRRDLQGVVSLGKAPEHLSALVFVSGGSRGTRRLEFGDHGEGAAVGPAAVGTFKVGLVKRS
eukprot:1695079-Heterocapsa_arctica.AAC.1